MFDLSVAYSMLPSQMMADCSSLEFTYLKKYYQMEPFGAVRDNWHMAVLASQFASAHTGKGRTPPKMSAYFYKDKTKQEDEQSNNFLTFLQANAKAKHE